MPDVYSNILEADSAIQERIAAILELRAADPQQVEFLDHYLKSLPFADKSQVLEIGCGTGAVTRALARCTFVTGVAGVDPSTILLNHARLLSQDYENVQFYQADARELPFEPESFDTVVLHTALCHIPGPEKVLEEAFRVLRHDGLLVIFDGDYASTSFAIGDNDPLEAVARAAVEVIAHDRWIVRKLPGLLRKAGFDVIGSRGYAYSAACDAEYMLTILDRGADALEASGIISEKLALALKDEGRVRAEQGNFFGLITYGKLLAKKRS
jgi:SAM-dependent methyltransferase